MTITIFTLCSNNYLSQAKVLYESMAQFNPNFKFVLGLVDKKKSSIDYANFIPCEVIEIESIFEDENTFKNMYSRYNITELNTSVKPFFFNYLFSKAQNDDQVYYLDPDIEIFAPLTELVDLLNNNNAVVTPHLLSPIFDDTESAPSESFIINAGLYNLGFIGFRKTAESAKMLKWWTDKCEKNCYIDHARGIFVDQSWISHAPIFFEDVLVLKKDYYNVAYWNLHERTVKKHNGTYLVNDKNKLAFFHFSGFSPAHPDVLAKYQNKYNFNNKPIKPIFDEYTEKLKKAGYFEFKDIKCYYAPKVTSKLGAKAKIKEFVKKYFNKL